MVYSMTGYGKGEGQVGDKTVLVELRALNGKQLDLRMQLPANLRPYEFEIRSQLAEGLQRGSVECFVTFKTPSGYKLPGINTELLKGYYLSLMETAAELGAGTDQLLASLVRLPEISALASDAIDEKSWEMIRDVLALAINDLDSHRKDEGASIESELLLRLEKIEEQSLAIAALEPLRRIKIKDNLKKTVLEQMGNDNVDENRFEQELIYYIEKIDIAEEQARLKNHIQYFRAILAEPEKSKGKKLSFLLQEFGREINTTGAKAYDSDIQKCVVLMKDELEKAKEQIFNVL